MNEDMLVLKREKLSQTEVLACMALHLMNRGFLPDIPENTQLARRLQAGGRLSSLSPPRSLMLVRSAGQIILGLWSQTFEGI